MDRIFLVLGAVMIAGIVSVVVGRRSDPPAANTHHVPRQLDRRDFQHPEARWLVVIFSSSTCRTCAGVLELAREVQSDDVAVQEVEVAAAKALHDRYRIDAVPTLVIADEAGAVRKSFIGPINPAGLAAALADLRH